MTGIILASGSPRRKALLWQLIGDSFEIIESGFEEDNNLPMKPEELVVSHARNKGKDVASKQKSGIVIAADTVVVYDGKVLGKPHTAENARAQLRMISNKTVEVYTGLAVIDINKGRELTHHERSDVIMTEITDSFIERYIASGEPLSLAGSFGIQGRGATIIERIEGSYSNIAGLPLYRLNKMLEELGFDIFTLSSS